ncbi:MAG: hypothetical protein IT531_23555 [Burkholderiales bacterium]|nr:hypothetical protein [Burkholderiales bacterium]
MHNARGREAINQLTGVTPKMFAPEFRAQMSLPEKVVINDITLREGRQIEGTILTSDECVKIAEILVHELNVPMLQMIGGYVARDREYLKAVARFLQGCGRKVRTEAMTSAHQNFPRFNKEQLLETVAHIGDCGFGAVICLASSDDMLRACAKHRNQQHWSIEDLRKQEIEIAVAAIEHAKRHGMTEINVNFQDFLRSDPKFLIDLSKAVAGAGVNVICLDDFGGGLATPRLYTELFRAVKRAVPATALGVHAHNSVGMAVATALAAVEGGCEVVNVGVNGYGDGAGHVSFAETVYQLEFLYGFDTGIRLDKMRPACVLIADILRQDLPKMAPLVGDNAFVMIADKHHSFPEYPFLFCPMKPEIVGNRARPGFGERAGPFGLKLHAAALGIGIPDDKVPAVLKALEDTMRWRKRALTDGEFRQMVDGICGRASAVAQR